MALPRPMIIFFSSGNLTERVARKLPKREAKPFADTTMLTLTRQNEYQQRNGSLSLVMAFSARLQPTELSWTKRLSLGW